MRNRWVVETREFENPPFIVWLLMHLAAIAVIVAWMVFLVARVG